MVNQDSEGPELDFTSGRPKSREQIQLLADFCARKLTEEQEKAVCLAIVKFRQRAVDAEVKNMASCLDGIREALYEGQASDRQLEGAKNYLLNMQAASDLSITSGDHDEEMLYRDAVDLHKAFFHEFSPQSKVSETSKHSFLSMRTLRIAGVILTAAAGGIFFLLNNKQSEICPDEPTAPVAQFVDLPDGTWGVLQKGSVYCTPSPFFGDNDRRELSLSQGGIYLKVAHNENLPFVVTTQNVEIMVLGTAFRIDSDPQEGLVRVLVEQGKVAVTLEGNKVAELTRGQRITVYSKIKQSHQDTFEVSKIDWHYSTIVFPGITLGDAAKVLESQYGVDIHFANPSMKNCTVTAMFPSDSSLNHILESLRDISARDADLKPRLKFKIRGKNVTLSGKYGDC